MRYDIVSYRQNKKPIAVDTGDGFVNIAKKNLFHDLSFASRPRPATTAGTSATNLATDDHDGSFIVRSRRLSQYDRAE
jgi:hypothetical protein